MASSDQVTRYFLKPASVAAVSATAVAIAVPNMNVKIPMLSGDYSLPLVVGVASFLVSELSEYINHTVFEHIPQISALSHPLHTGLNVGVIAGGVAAVENLVSPGLVGDLGLGKIVGIAALAEVSSTYLAHEWLKPYYEKMYPHSM
jgi:hypothetical protein